MKEWLLHIYDYIATRRKWLWIGTTILTLALLSLAVSLRYDENIMDFMPVTPEEQAALDSLQSQQSAARIVLIIEGDSLTQEALDLCMDRIPQLETEPDWSEQIQTFYSLIPYYIADSTYRRLDSLFTPQAIRNALERDQRILSTPGTSALATAIQHDPLGLIPLSTFDFGLSTDKRSYAFIDSPYGSTETKQNAALVDSLNQQIAAVQENFPNVSMRWVGAPVIAVGNARRIKTDSLLCIALALVCIIALLAYAFPRRRDILLIMLAVSFGWLTGMAVLRIVTPVVSAVVIGIGSVLIGIAVNYPLHLLVHQRYTTSVRQTLDEVLSPLIVGNITTVGAFLALVPLQASALRYLGVFAASMLVGTIIFCIFVMPHLMSAEPTKIRDIRIAQPNPRRANVFQWIIVATTAILIPFALSPFNLSPSNPIYDTNLSHINYMTDRQRADLAYFDSVANPQRVIEQNAYKADLWQHYWLQHDTDSLIALIQTQAEQLGFTTEAFEPFYNYLASYNPLTSNSLNINPPLNMNIIAERLSDNFDYLGLCCSLIVFIFLIISFRNFWLALIAFAPMAVSWIWIFAIMQLFGIQFNIVNIILATFIFGQGDDYTIFIVEGLVYEHQTGRKILPQYRQSIILSAVIMLIGIGILVFARHPAMYSLGVITLIGMSVTLLMSITIPPLLYKWYTMFIDKKN